VDVRFNQPGTATADNWSQRLDKPLSVYSDDPALGPKFRFLRDAIVETGREPKAG
jgi:4-alpha-glucanotransferase